MREPTLLTPSLLTTITTEEREAGINCEGDDGERAEEQVITARLLLERRGQSVECHATCTIPMIPQEGGTDSSRGNEGDREGGREREKQENVVEEEEGGFLCQKPEI